MSNAKDCDDVLLDREHNPMRGAATDAKQMLPYSLWKQIRFTRQGATFRHLAQGRRGLVNFAIPAGGLVVGAIASPPFKRLLRHHS
jgi:hypothetical protein